MPLTQWTFRFRCRGAGKKLTERPALKFEFTLCLALGVTLGRLREEMSSAEMAAWIAFNRIDPIGEMRADLRTAQILQQQASMYRKKGSEPPKLEDFMLFHKKEAEKPKTARQLADKFMSIFARK